MKNKNTYLEMMPQDPADKIILHERALQLAKSTEINIKDNKKIKYVRFTLGNNEHYGIDYQYIKEILKNITLTKVPGAPKSVAGLINLRGNLLAIMDLKQFFHLEISEYQNNIDIIMLEFNRLTLGILTDKIEGSDHYDSALLNTTMVTTNIIKPKYIIGFHNGTENIKFSTKITAILHTEALIADLSAQ